MSVSLTKGQKVSLSKDGGSLTRIFMGLGWDVAKKGGFLGKLMGGGEVDLDASCLVFDESKTMVDQIWFRQLKGMKGAIVHTGDNRTGAGEGDDEVIKVDLSNLPANVSSLVFTVNSFTGQDFNSIANAFCRVVDDTTGEELAKFTLSEAGSHTGLVMARLYRHSGDWKLHAVGEKTSGRTFHDMMPAITAAL
ncbi:TerD family protein [uncultured Rhodospira sp.]|uniref:TerD family protein n=1 Tax=uncultured Rhodospira sp. TaxID=1936189 RepID=UPI00260F6D00|nr:TerD family protein [uncultured Rhodospira sp.]